MLYQCLPRRCFAVMITLLSVPFVQGQVFEERFQVASYPFESPLVDTDVSPVGSDDLLQPPAIGMDEMLSRLEATEYELSRLRSQMLCPQHGLAAAKAGNGGSDGGGAEGDNGTNPAVFRKRVAFYNEYYDIGEDSFLRANLTHLFMVWPILDGKGVFNVDIPVTNVDGTLGEASGIGDVRFRFIVKKESKRNKKLTWLYGTEFYVPSADSTILPVSETPEGTIQFGQVGFGSQKYRLAPLISVVYAPRKDLIIVPMLFHQFSFAGDGAAPDINQTWLRLFTMKAFKTGTYLLPELQVIADWEKDGQTDVYLAPEIGQLLGRKDSTTVYLKPGAGVTGGFSTRNWGVECGLRFAY